MIKRDKDKTRNRCLKLYKKGHSYRDISSVVGISFATVGRYIRELDERASNEEFEIFYAAYPNKKAKKAAHKAWLKAKDKPPVPELLRIVEEQCKWRSWKQGYIPHPATWLNQGRWLDEPDPENKKPIFLKSKSVT